MEVRFVVEHAGCASCAERVRTALTSIGEVCEIEIDAADDSADVRVELSPEVSVDTVDNELVRASVGSGHEYRVRPGSWHAAS